MVYSLANRVRGAFLGALLGENLAIQNDSNFGEIAVLSSESLINFGKLDVQDWLKFYQQAAFNINTGNIAGIKTILATLPLAIFFHEDTIKFKNNLLEILNVWETDAVVTDVALTIGYAIAKSLTNTLNPLTLIPQTIHFLNDTKTLIPQKLLIVKSFLEAGAGLEQAHSEFARQEQLSNNLALAVYCFLSSLDDFHLTMLRVNQHCGFENSEHLGLQTRSCLTGILSGAYNSSEVIPVNWQMFLSASNQPLWGEKDCSQILKLAKDLVAVWSGAYNITPQTHQLQKDGSKVNWEIKPVSIIAAPNVIRPRSGISR